MAFDCTTYRWQEHHESERSELTLRDLVAKDPTPLGQAAANDDGDVVYLVKGIHERRRHAGRQHAHLLVRHGATQYRIEIRLNGSHCWEYVRTTT